MCKTLTITPKLTFMSLKFELNDLTVSASLLQLASVNTLLPVFNYLHLHLNGNCN